VESEIPAALPEPRGLTADELIQRQNERKAAIAHQLQGVVGAPLSSLQRFGAGIVARLLGRGIQSAPAGLVNIGGTAVAAQMVPYVQALAARAREMGASFRITSGYRSPAEQDALRMRWEAGDPSVIYPPAEHSYHELGLAVDIESDMLSELGAYAESSGL
jgi:hypothetical protein